MKVRLCRDCAYSKIKGTRRVCIKYISDFNTDIRQIERCPMGYTYKDIEWAEQKDREDAIRTKPLYVRG